MNINSLNNLVFLIALLLINTSMASNKIMEPISIELDIPEYLEEDFQKYSDLIDFGDVSLFYFYFTFRRTKKTTILNAIYAMKIIKVYTTTNINHNLYTMKITEDSYTTQKF